MMHIEKGYSGEKTAIHWRVSAYCRRKLLSIALHKDCTKPQAVFATFAAHRLFALK